MRTVLDGLLLGESILRWDRSYLMLRVVEFEYSMKHSLESEDNRSIKILCLDLVSLVHGSIRTQSHSNLKRREEGSRQSNHTLAFVTM